MAKTKIEISAWIEIKYHERIAELLEHFNHDDRSHLVNDMFRAFIGMMDEDKKAVLKSSTCTDTPVPVLDDESSTADDIQDTTTMVGMNAIDIFNSKVDITKSEAYILLNGSRRIENDRH